VILSAAVSSSADLGAAVLNFVTFVIIGLATGAIYSIAATGLVLTFTTSRIFNLAHGAVGMFLAFVYYQLRIGWRLPEAISLPLVVLVAGPLFGVALNVTMMQRLTRTSVAIRLTGTLALLVLLDGLAVLIWGNGYRTFPGIASDNTFAVANVRISYNQLTTIVLALAIAGLLWAFLRRTRLGTAMRAVVDDSQLAELTAISPMRIQSVSWAIGCSLAGLAAILITPSVSLDIPVLSLLVVSAFAAAVIGGLASVGLTYVGGLALGIGGSLLTLYLPQSNQFLQGIPPSLPFIILFLALSVMRQERQALARVTGAVISRPARVPSILGWSAVLVVAAAVIAPHLSAFSALIIATGLVYASILLSMVLLTGMAGQVSLCQFSFVGIGAVTLAHLSHYMPYALAALCATGVTALAGTLIALPALRLRGLYIALATFAFAVMCDNLVFSNSDLLGTAGEAITAPAPSILGLTLTSQRGFVLAGAVLASLFAAGIQFARRGKFGRALSAMRDSPVAATALGLRLVRTKLLVFGISAGMAGLAGCLFAGLLGQVGGSQFSYMMSLTALLILAIQGTTSVPGAVLGGAFYAIVYLLLPDWISNPTVVDAIQPITIGLAVFGILRHPEGTWPVQARGFRTLVSRYQRATRHPAASETAANAEAEAGTMARGQ
jgi:branched-chain amino acid transport system permease protein